jgi:hypothetical protein
VVFVPLVATPPEAELPPVEELPPVVNDPPAAFDPPDTTALPPEPPLLVLALLPPVLVAVFPPALVFDESDWPQAPSAKPTNPKTNRIRV